LRVSYALVTYPEGITWRRRPGLARSSTGCSRSRIMPGHNPKEPDRGQVDDDLIEPDRPGTEIRRRQGITCSRVGISEFLRAVTTRDAHRAAVRGVSNCGNINSPWLAYYSFRGLDGKERLSRIPGITHGMGLTGRAGSASASASASAFPSDFPVSEAP
jgi:hypothetical protein